MHMVAGDQILVCSVLSYASRSAYGWSGLDRADGRVTNVLMERRFEALATTLGIVETWAKPDRRTRHEVIFGVNYVSVAQRRYGKQ